MSGYLSIDYASLTDVGVRRSHNQDAHVALAANDLGQWEQRGHLFLVADGMGAHAVGELASKIAIDNIPHIYQKHTQEGASAAIRRAILETNTAIHTRGQQNREFEGMGTTGTLLLLRPEGVWLGHVGDSRAYRVRGGNIEQLTFDHSLVWELARRQGVRPEELQGIPSNVIVRSLGPEPLVQVDIEGPHPIEPGDIFVLCSDGLSGPVSDREIGAVASTLPPKDACRFLIDLANLQGGPDNITVIVVKVAGGDTEGGAEGEDLSANGTHTGLGPGRNNQPHEGPPGPRWYQRLPWTLLLMLLGILLALGAITVVAYAHRGAGMVLFVLAALSFGVGLIGLWLQNRHDSEASQDGEEDNHELRIHRQMACGIDEALLHRLAKAEANLETRIRDRNWSADCDWDDCKLHSDKARQFEASGSLTEAFREYCLAMRPLSEVVQRHRHKEEIFQPVWDKNSN